MRNNWRSLLIVFGFIIFLVALPTEKRAEKTAAKAASLSAYPTYCLGGWENPGNAAGEPNVAEGEDSFSGSNSAYLNQKAAQIFCGYFQSNDKSYPPKSVTLKFSWKMVFENQTVQSATSSSTDENIWASTLNSTSTFTSSTTPTSTPTSSEPIIIDNASSSIIETVPVILTATTSFINASSTATDSIILPAAPDNSSSTATSSSAFWNLFVQKVFAQSDSLSQGFLNVSYNLEDGKNWQSAGQVTEANWQRFSVSIPVTSWDDIEKLQVQLTPTLAVDMPIIYLDGMWLEVDYDHSILDTVKESASAVLDTVSNVSDSVNNALDAVTNAIDSVLNPEKITLVPDNITPPLSQPAPIHRYNLSVGTEIPIGTAPLPWIGDEKTHNVKNSATDAPLGIISTGKNTIQIQGSCSDDYVAILLFAHPTDYVTDPSLALFDKVYRCENGGFNQQFSDNDFPPSLSGDYYLLTADQGERGPWKPHSIIYRVSFAQNSTSTPGQ